MLGTGSDDRARVGPNAVIQTALVARERLGRGAEKQLLREAGLPGYVARLPDDMIDEREAARLFEALFRTLPRDQADAVAEEADRRTGDYILDHRIPKPAQRLLRLLPRRFAARVLLGAIARHAWTFAGSGHVTTTTAPDLTLTIRANPVAMPACPWHREVIGRLFRSLVTPSAAVRHTECYAAGAPACRFVVDLVPEVRPSPAQGTPETARTRV